MIKVKRLQVGSNYPYTDHESIQEKSEQILIMLEMLYHHTDLENWLQIRKQLQ